MKKKNQIVPNNSFTEFLLYTTPNGKVKVEIFLRDENIWLTQAKIAELFGVERSVVTKHLQNPEAIPNFLAISERTCSITISVGSDFGQTSTQAVHKKQLSKMSFAFLSNSKWPLW